MTTPTKQQQAFINKMTSIGLTLGNNYIKADDSANKNKRELILTNADKFADNAEHVTYILEGYAKAFKDAGYSDNTVKQRKSEANAIYKCVALTAISKAHIDALIAHVGDFNSMVQLARDLTKAHHKANAKTTDTPAVKKSPAVRPATALQLASVNGILQKANVTDLINVSDKIVSELNRVDSNIAETSQFKLIANIANSIMGNDKFDQVSKQVAKDVFKLVNVHLNKLEKVTEHEVEPQQVAM